jgi:hypothetical protein
MEVRTNLVVGKKDVDIATPSHVRGVHEGNWPEARVRRARARGKDPATAGGAARSTGINPEAREPIDRRMPRLSPA